MCTTQEATRIIDEIVKFVQRGEMFTSVDIGNSIKRGDRTRQPEWIKNRDVANFLREQCLNVISSTCQIPYTSSTIYVSARGIGNVPAALYHPVGANPDDYKNTQQSALSPDQFNQVLDITGDSGTTQTSIDWNADNTMTDIEDDDVTIVDQQTINDHEGYGLKIPLYIENSHYLTRISIKAMNDMSRSIGLVTTDPVTARGLMNNTVLKILYSIGFVDVAEYFKTVKNVDLNWNEEI